MWLWLVVWLLCVGSAGAQTGPRSLTLHAAGTTGNGAVLNTVGYSTVAVAVAGVAGGANLVITFEGSVDGTNYTALTCREFTANTLASTSTASGTTLTQWSCPVAGMQKFRTRISGGSTGALNVTASALPQVSWIPPSDGGGGGAPSGSAGGALAGTYPDPTLANTVANVRNPPYSATGDGTTDDTVAIQAALDAGTGTVFVPQGTYVISQLTVPVGVSLIGAGMVSPPYAGTVLLQKDGVNASAIIGAACATATAYWHWSKIADLQLRKASGSTDTVGSAIDVTCRSGEGLRFEHLEIADFPEHGIYYRRGGTTVYLNDLHIFRSGGSGLRLERQSADIWQAVGVAGLSGDGNTTSLVYIKLAGAAGENFHFSDIKAEATGTSPVRQPSVFILDNLLGIPVYIENMSVTVSGGATVTEMVKVITSVTRVFLIGARCTTCTNIINDVVNTVTVPLSGNGNLTWLAYHNSRVSKRESAGATEFGLGLGQAVAFPANGGVLEQTGFANNLTLHKITRKTDTSPTGNFADYLSAAAASLWTVDITGTLTAGTIPVARISGGGTGDAFTTNPLSQFASTTSAQLAGVLSDETGTGVAVYDTAPTLTGTLTIKETTANAVRGINQVQNSDDTSSARYVASKSRGTYGSPTTVVSGDVLGSVIFQGHDGTGYLSMGAILSTSTGTIGTSRVPTTLRFQTATDAAPSVLTTALTLNADQSATFAGVVTATSYNKVALTSPATSATLTIADGKTLTVSNTLTLTGTDTSSVAFGAGGTVLYPTSTTATPQFAGLGLGNAAGASGLIVTSALANCFTVGPNGTTTPTFSLDCSVASAANGIQVVPTASGSGVTLQATGGTNEGVTLTAKGSSSTVLSTVTGSILLRPLGTTRYTLSSTQHTLATAARSASSATGWSYTGGADTTLTAGTEVKDFLVDLSQTKQHASNTTIALQRHINFLPGTDTCASATCTITEDALLSLTGPPTGGTNSAITQSEALLIETRALTNVTNGFGLVVNAPSAASGKNYAAKFTGDVVVAGHTQAGAAIGAVSSCGTSASVAGSDGAFRVTVGTTVTTSSCTIAFGTAFPTAPICVANDETSTLLIKAVPTTTQVVLSTATAFQNDVIGVLCRGYE